MKRLWLACAVLGFTTWVATASSANAAYSSANYSANEIQFGIGGDPQQQSSSYKAQVSVGSTGVGDVSSTNYKAFSGFLTPNEVFLEMGIDSTSVNLGNLDPSSTRTGTAIFHVRAYLDSGYTVQTVSQPPAMTSGSATHTLCAMSSPNCNSITPTPGIEQFGINLVANTSPTTFGANPAPQPDSNFATGQAAPAYNAANQFKYSVGDVIAQTNISGWGATNYTISYVANASVSTPSGSYTMIHDLVAVVTY
jgi:hypothetical protein